MLFWRDPLEKTPPTVLKQLAAVCCSVGTAGTTLVSIQQLLPAPNIVTIQLGPERKARIFLPWCCVWACAWKRIPSTVRKVAGYFFQPLAAWCVRGLSPHLPQVQQLPRPPAWQAAAMSLQRREPGVNAVCTVALRLALQCL